MNPEIVYYLLAACLAVLNLGAWATSLFTLPGNWIVVVITALFAAFVHPPHGEGVSWTVVGVAVGLALLGELVEFAAGAAGAAKHGGRRRGMLLAIGGAMIGSIAGGIVGVPVPVVGSVLGALGGGALGAFCGAYLGETWKGKTGPERMAVSTAALVGRLLGTVGKLAVGVVMVVVITIDSFVI
jgi:uncharacterized protein YqgC (DUF456 family)